MASAAQRSQAPIAIEALTGVIDLKKGSYFFHILSTNTTFSFVNRPADITMFRLIIHHNGGAATWPYNVRWAGGIAPSGMTIGKVHVFEFMMPQGNGSDQWIGTYILNS